MGPPPAGLTAIEDLFKHLVSISVGLAFVALLVVLVLAGIKFMTSGGDKKALQSASMTVTWGLLGILFLALVWLILLLIENFTGIKLATFNIKILCLPIPGLCP